jgi:hypothetical protein
MGEETAWISIIVGCVDVLNNSAGATMWLLEDLAVDVLSIPFCLGVMMAFAVFCMG